MLLTALTAPAQVASHAPSGAGGRNRPGTQFPRCRVSDKPVARVNGAVLTDRDLLREMFAIFPYAKQHNGFPKAQEACHSPGRAGDDHLRGTGLSGSGRRKLTIPAARLNQAEVEFRKQFNQSR